MDPLAAALKGGQSPLSPAQKRARKLGKDVAQLVHGGSDVLLRFTETVRLRVFGRVYNYKQGEVHCVSLAMVGLLLAEDCVEPVDAEPVAQVA